MHAVIMAGGRGVRLRPMTDSTPKPLLPLGDTCAAEILIQRLASGGFDTVHLALNHHAGQFEERLGDGSRWDLRLRHWIEDEPRGTAGALADMRDALEGHVLVTNGDLLTNLDFGAVHRAHVEAGRSVTLCTRVLEVPVPYGIVRTDDDGAVTGFDEKPHLSTEINAGIYVVDSDLLDRVPASGMFHMTELLEDLMADGVTVGRHRITDYWLDIGEVDLYDRAQRVVEDGEVDFSG